MAKSDKIGTLVDKTAETVTIEEEGKDPISLGDMAKTFLKGAPNAVKNGDRVTYTIIKAQGKPPIITYVAKSGFVKASATTAKQSEPKPEAKPEPKPEPKPATKAQEPKPEQKPVEPKKENLKSPAEIRAAQEAFEAKSKAEAEAELKAKGATQKPTTGNPAKEQANYQEPIKKSPESTGQPISDDVSGIVELGVTINIGNYSSFSLKVTGSSGEHARRLLLQEAEPTIRMVRAISRAALSDAEIPKIFQP